MTSDVDPALTGAAFDLANAGYTPMRDPVEEDEKEEIGSDGATLRQAAEKISVSPDLTAVRAYHDGSGKPVASNEAVTLDRAARDYAGVRAIEKVMAEGATSKVLAERVDALRAAALAHDPEAAEFYGFDLPKDSHKKESSGENAQSEPDARDHERTASRLDAELQTALQHPQVIQAIEQKIGEAEKARQDYRDGLAAAAQIAQMTFLSQFPELVGVRPETLPGVLEQISRQDPAKLGCIQSVVAATEQLFAQQAAENERQELKAQQVFIQFAQAEDDRLEAMLKGEPKETRFAVANEVLASARESGIEPAELNHLFHTEPLMRNATFQRMMYDAGKYRLMMKAKAAALTRQLPPVQRPGAASSAGQARADLRTLNARLSSSGNIKDAVALYQARKSSKK